MNNKVLIFVLVAFIVGGAVGYELGQKNSNKNTRAGQMGVVIPAGNFSGVIKSFDGKKLSVELTGSRSGEVMDVSVMENTKVVKMERKTDEQYQKELSLYRSALANFQKNPNTVAPMPVLRVSEVSAGVKDLISGIRVSVISDSSVASKIVIQLASSTVPGN